MKNNSRNCPEKEEESSFAAMRAHSMSLPKERTGSMNNFVLY